MSQSSNQELHDMLESIKKDLIQSITVLQDASSKLSIEDAASLKRGATIIRHMVDSMTKATDKITLMEMEKGF